MMQGCSGAVERVLKKMDGVENISIDLPSQKVAVVVREGINPEQVKETVAKSGKATDFWR